MRLPRREFLKAAGVGLAGSAFGAPVATAAIILEPAQSGPVKWAAGRLKDALDAKGTRTVMVSPGNRVPGAELYVVVAHAPGPVYQPEEFSLSTGTFLEKPCLNVWSSSPRGFVYALLEAADRVQHGSDLMAPTREKPANQVRSIARAFVSDVEDKPWFYDREFWREYLTMLATQRFNRFTLTLGLGYDFPRQVTGDYLHFPYPYLLDVPGYTVRPVPLGEGEREKNLQALTFISEETAARGLHFQLAIWTHAYQWTDSPKAQHHIEGLTPETHGPYCRDAMALLLKTCPAIQGVTMRVHGESGIPEGSIDFWRYVFQGIVRGGRQIDIDLHAKGLDPAQLELAQQTGMPVTISPKYWAEHMGLGYHQAAIRELEMPRHVDEKSIFKFSEGSRRFLRYGYGDLFQEGSKYKVLFRMWPGTQKLLLWGDPVTAAAYGRASSYCGASGVEICEPLFFKGRQGSGLPGGRCAYADESLNPAQDWRKYEYTYRVWGRLLYNPQADPDQWRRSLRTEFGPAAGPVEDALSRASRVLPLFTTTRQPSASNLGCWPEIYTNMPIVEGGAPVPYGDTASPKRLGTVTALDPQMFSTVEEHVDGLRSGRASGKYSPVEVATWFEDLTGFAAKALSAADGRAPDKGAPGFRRMAEDVAIQIGLGRFFAAQIRSAVLFDIYKRTGDPAAKNEAIAAYRKARAAWSAMANRAARVYRADITFGDIPVRRGHWLDRLPAIDQDLAAMEAFVAPPKDREATQLIAAALGKGNRPAVQSVHQPTDTFVPGRAVALTIRTGGAASGVLFYRHVDQAERWQSVPLTSRDGGWTAAIPEDYTKSPFALQYYFELRRDPSTAWLYPGFGSDLANVPYFTMLRSGRS